MQKTMKKTLSIILAILMIVTTAPFAFAAETPIAKIGDVEYTDFNEALANWVDGTTLVLLADTPELTENIEIKDKTVVLELNGHIMQFSTTEIKRFGILENGGLTIRDSIGTGEVNTCHSSAYIHNKGSLTIEDGTLIGAIFNWTGILTMTGGKVVGYSSRKGYDTQATDGDGTFNFYGGTLKGSHGVWDMPGAVVNFSGAVVVEATDDICSGQGTTTITGGTFSHAPTDYVVEGCDITENDNGTWSVACNHSFTNYVETTAPTCTKTGLTTAKCDICSIVTDEKEIPATNHKDTIVQVDAKAPTCTEIGWDAYEYCTACDYSTYVELPAITHTDANCDYKCDYNCGYVYETLDFSDAKAITEENGILYIDGEKAEDDGVTFLLHAGKYKLAENISTSYIWIEGEVVLDLNGYVWDLEDSYIAVNAPFSVYDTSAEENGKITSTFFCTIDTNSEYGVFSLYSGTIENNSVYEDRMAISAMWASANLYGGKVKGNGYALSASSDYNIDKTVVLGDVVLESGEGYAQIKLSLKSYVDGKKINIDVTDYTGESLETDVEAEYAGKFDIIKGVSSADEAEKYKLNIIELYGLFHEKTEYDEEAGDVNIYIAKNAFTQQPSAKNCFTADFNNPAATLQWYEVEEKDLGSYIAVDRTPLFEYDFKAGDILKVSTDSELDLAVINTGAGALELSGYKKTATLKFNADMTALVMTRLLYAQNPVSLAFSVIKETALDGETGETLKNPECQKSYYCKATANGRVYNSDTVVGHEIIQVEEKAPTCKEVGWEAYEYCTACDYTTYVEKEALKHSFTKYEVTEEAKCGVAGKEVAACDNGCGATDEKAIEALKHDIVIDEAVAPKCGETGLTQGEHCTRCDYKVEQEIVPALEHKDADGDYKCDNGCGHEFEKPAPEEPTPDTPDEPTDEVCDHLCHKGGFMGFIWKIVKFFWKLFKMNPVCECGAAHY